MAHVTFYEHQVQYYETDQMAIAHHSNYIRWFEEARIRFFEELGLGYKQSEAEGIISPVVSVEANYKSMSRFYDIVVIRVSMTDYTGVRCALKYEIRDKETGELRCTGRSKHCFIDPNGKVLSIKRVSPERHKLFEEAVERED
ncbi:acyl-CoA thioester hydrolase [Ruminococcaceae bacterium YRB3002]|nr:acyl-CoA thioester hydrolase [Ruminococcaceae bacterium YRB3002]